MNLDEQRRNWEKFGADDPLWRILSVPEKRGGKWGPEEFFATGRVEIESAFAWLADLGVTLRHGSALDFGCGVGRLTQALADHFDRVVGVDISGTMLEQAVRYNRKEERCRYVQNGRADLALFPGPEFDLVYSSIVLQHIAPRFVRRYIPEFVRVLRPGGVAVFQLPSQLHYDPGGSPRLALRRLIEHLVPQSLMYAYHRARYGEVPFSLMYAVQERTVLRLVRQAGAEVVDVERADGPRCRNARYVVRKPPSPAT